MVRMYRTRDYRTPDGTGFFLQSDDLRNLVPSIYVDSCVLADAVMDRGNIPTTKEVKNEIPVMKRIFMYWPKERMVISPFVVGEILELGKKYGKNLDEMQELVRSEILPRCTLTFTDIKEFRSFSETYHSIGVNSLTTLNIATRGDATDKEGRVYANMEKDRHILYDGREVSGISGGIPPGGEIPKPTAQLTNEEVLSISSPLVEIGIFHRAAQIRHESGSPWKDAFHFIYAKKEHCVYIVTNDNGLLEMDSLPKDWPTPITPSGLRDGMSAWLSPDAHSAIFGKETADGNQPNRLCEKRP